MSPTDEQSIRDDERARIVRYLRHVARVEVGSVLFPASREVVGWCASWIDSRLDVDYEEQAAAQRTREAAAQPPDDEANR